MEAYSCTPHKEIRRLTPRLQKSAVSGRELADWENAELELGGPRGSMMDAAFLKSVNRVGPGGDGLCMGREFETSQPYVSTLV